MVLGRFGTWRVIGALGSFVLAHEPDSPTPYVTWRVVGDGVENGNYFDDMDSAIEDLIERAGYGS